MFDGYRLDILGVSEVRWTKSGRINCDGMTFMYIGHEDRHEHGVGLVLSRRATGVLVGWTPVSDWTITARFAYGHEKATIVQAYAPTDCAEETIKDGFYKHYETRPLSTLKVLCQDGKWTYRALRDHN